MPRIYANMTALIGGTPLIEVSRFTEKMGIGGARILVKFEAQNPCGSVKDRIALAMIEDAERSGRINADCEPVIIEPTSGNTGIGLAAVCASRGYRAIIVMPDTMSVERRKLIAAYGAEIVLTDGKLGMKGAIAEAQRLASEIPNSIIPSQFDNPANPKCHETFTGMEIWRDTDGAVDAVVAGVGSGGTITGIGRCLKKLKSDIKIVAVEPSKSPVLSGGVAGSHGIQGIGAGFVTENTDVSVIDEIVRADEENAFACARLLAKTEGLLAGISSGAALYGACEIAKTIEFKGKTIVVILPDTGERYLSTDLYI
jgi:cysteine synthase A